MEALLSERLPEAVVCAPPEVLKSNVISACLRGLPQVPRLPAHDARAILCAGGPSLKRSLEEVRKRHRRGDTVFCVNKTSNYLIDNGIIPRCIVLCDPQEVLVDQFAADARCAYLVASQCHPSVFNRLSGLEVHIWHCQCDSEKAWILPFYKDPVLASSGTTAALRTIDLVYVMGFRRLDIYGLDGSFEAGEDGKLAHHAYQQAEDDVPPVVEIIARNDNSEKRFWTRSDFARQADEFMNVLHAYHAATKVIGVEPYRVTVHGDGLIPYLWRKRRQELHV